MSIFSRLFKKPSAAPDLWPNNHSWAALKNEQNIETEDGMFYVFTIPCGDLALPSGRLVACDPFVCLSPTGMPFITTPQGRLPVVVTLADVSEHQDRSHIREAYASIIFSNEPECHRRTIPLTIDGEKPPKLGKDEFIGFAVDAGTACFVDETLVGSCMPDPATWYDSIFENEHPDCWFRQMDDPTHIRHGIANISLPLAKNGENIILFHSGWGDGHFPIVGSYDAANRLVAVHIDFLVIR
jgi:hypothetical protein